MAWRNVSGFENNGKFADISTLKRDETSHLRVQWMPLALKEFGGVHSGQMATGVLVELPWLQESRIALGCSVAAAWHDGLVRSIRSKAYGAWSIQLSGNDFGNLGDSPDAPLHNRPVQLTPEWLDLLFRLAPDSSAESKSLGLNTIGRVLGDSDLADIVATYRDQPQLLWSNSASVCHLMMMNQSLTDTKLLNDDACGKGGMFYFVEMVIAASVADGLSRHGSCHAYLFNNQSNSWQVKSLEIHNSTGLLAHVEGTLQPPQQTPSAWLEVYVNGYAYYPSTISDYLALAVVGLYMVLAGSHVISILVLPKHRTTSGAWDTITELLLLCYTSLPPKTPRLKNTSAGIHRSQTYGVVLKLVAAREDAPPPASTSAIGHSRQEPEKLYVIADGDEGYAETGRNDGHHSDSCSQHDTLITEDSTQGFLEMQP